jgi:hypothetical protein
VFHYLGPAFAVLLFATSTCSGWRGCGSPGRRRCSRCGAALAAAGARTLRNVAALALTVGGVAALADLRLAGQPLGFAFGNCALFMLYVVLGTGPPTPTPIPAP